MRPLFRRLSEYNFQFGVATQARRNPDFVHRLLGAFGDDGINEWFAARLERNELRGYLSDLDEAHALANASDTDTIAAIGLVTRYALFRASIRSVADHLPPALLARLVENGETTTEQATTWGLMNTESGPAFELMVEALRSSGGAILAEQWLEAVDLGARIVDADNRVLSIVRFYSDMPVHLRQRMLDVIAQEANEGSRSGALCSLAEVADLDDHSKKEMWRIATEIKQDNIRPEALVVVGARLDRAEQIEAIATYGRALSDEVDSRLNGTAIKASYGSRLAVDRAAQHLAKYPSDLLLELARDVDEPAMLEALNGAILIQQTEDDSAKFFDQVIDSSYVIPDVVLQRVCLAVGKEGRVEDALRCLGEMSDETSDHYGVALAGLLARSWSEGQIAPLIALFEKLGHNSQQGLQETVIKQVVSGPGVDEHLLRSLVSRAKDERQRLFLRSEIGHVLGSDEIDELIDHSADFPKIAGNLAPDLSADKAKRALTVIEHSLFYEAERTALLKRLCELGHIDDVLYHLREGMIPLEIKTAAAALAEVWPPARLSELFATIRPEDTTQPVTRLRAWLHAYTPAPRQSLIPVFRQMIARATRPQRLEQLTKIAMFEMSLGDRTWLLEEVIEAFRLCLAEVASPRAQNAVGRSLADLAELGAGQHLPDFVATIVSDVVACDAEPYRKIEWLVTIASGDSPDDDRLIAWLAAYNCCICQADDNGFQEITASLREHDVPLLGRIARSLPADRWLILFAATAGPAVDENTADFLTSKIAEYPDALMRLFAYQMVLDRASIAVRTAVAQCERARSITFRSPETRCDWDIVLEHAAPGALDCEAFKHLLDAIDDPESRAYALNSALRLEMLRPWAIERLTDLVEDLEGELKFLVLTVIAPSLLPDDIAAIVKFSSWNGAVSSSALAALASSALRQDALAIFIDCVAAEDPHFRVEIVEPLLGSLSVEGLEWCTEVERSNQAERFTFSNRDRGYPTFTSSHLSALARRAAELGAFELMADFIELKRGSTSSGDHSLGQILAAVEPRHFDTALCYALEAESGDRSEAVAALLHKWPDHTSMNLLDGIVSDFLTRMYVNERKLAALLEEPLKRVSGPELLTLYRKAINHGLRGRRGDILDIITIFARPLIARFGPMAALALDEACALGCAPHWP